MVESYVLLLRTNRDSDYMTVWWCMFNQQLASFISRSMRPPCRDAELKLSGYSLVTVHSHDDLAIRDVNVNYTLARFMYVVSNKLYTTCIQTILYCVKLCGTNTTNNQARVKEWVTRVSTSLLAGWLESSHFKTSLIGFLGGDFSATIAFVISK